MTKPRSHQQLLFTVGHSNHEWDAFLALLKQHQISAIADVRSSPYSRFTPQFNRETIDRLLSSERIHYVFLGAELGARRIERDCYENGRASYKRIAATPAFADGIERIRSGMTEHRIALMCAEKDPLTCHRTILVCRALRDENLEIHHILENGDIEPMQAPERRLLSLVGQPQE